VNASGRVPPLLKPDVSTYVSGTAQCCVPGILCRLSARVTRHNQSISCVEFCCEPVRAHAQSGVVLAAVYRPSATSQMQPQLTDPACGQGYGTHRWFAAMVEWRSKVEALHSRLDGQESESNRLDYGPHSGYRPMLTNIGA
jgi:hypothetical protein